MQNLTPEAAYPFPLPTHTHTHIQQCGQTLNKGQSSELFMAPFRHNLVRKSIYSTVYTAQSRTCTIYKNLPGLNGRCGVLGYFTPVSGIVETHAMCMCVLITRAVSCPPTSANKLVGGADCSAWCSIYIVAFVLILSVNLHFQCKCDSSTGDCIGSNIPLAWLAKLLPGSLSFGR